MSTRLNRYRAENLSTLEGEHIIKTDCFSHWTPVDKTADGKGIYWNRLTGELLKEEKDGYVIQRLVQL